MPEINYTEKAKKLLSGFNFTEETYTHCEEFLIAKDQYIKNPSVDNSVMMKLKYTNVYFDIKHYWVLRGMSDAEFRNVVEKLREGV